MFTVKLKGCSLKQNRILKEIFVRSLIYDAEDYVHVPAKAFGRDYKQALEELIEKEIVERDNHYIVGEMSRAYHIPLHIQDELIVKLVHVEPSFALRWLESPWCDFSAKWMVDSFKRAECEIGPFARDSRLLLMAAKKLFFVKDSTAGRIHTNVTGLKKKSRAALRIDGEPLMEIDMVNCQPFLLARMGREESFMKMCNDGIIYDHLASKLGMTRDDTKELYFKTIYGRVQYADPKMRSIFAQEFPQTWATIVQAKKENHANLAVQLQREEVAMMEVVWADLARASIPFLTIHDAILVKLGDLEKAIELMKAPNRPVAQVKHGHS